MGKKYMVIMTNGDTYNVSVGDFVRVKKAMEEEEKIVGVSDTVNNLELTLLVANISAAVEREARHA